MLRSFLFLTAVAAAAHADDLLPGYPAVEPKDVAKTFRVKNGFTMDLIAAEPLVSSPVAIAYDENGAAYVVEMRDYPYTNKDTHQADAGGARGHDSVAGHGGFAGVSDGAVRASPM